MASILHRVDKTFIDNIKQESADLADPAEWIKNPDMSAVLGIEPKYWKITGDLVEAMNQTEMDAADLAILEAQRDALAELLESVESYERAFAMIVMDEINELRGLHGLQPRTVAQLKTALRSKLGL